MKALKEAGYNIPGDVAIVGFDDMPICEYLDPPLSTIEVPKYYMGEVAARRLMEIAGGTSTGHFKIEVSVRLTRRRSV